MIILAGDIGGTSMRLQLVKFDKEKNNAGEVLNSMRYNNSEYASFAEIIDTFFADVKISHKQVQSACFAIAGPIIDGVVKFTNLPWLIRLKEMREKFENPNVALINDFEGVGYGIETLKANEFYTLQAGHPQENAVRAYIGAGTGLGVGYMVSHTGSYTVYPSEGGHIDFAPGDDMEVQLLQYLRKKYHRVSFERVLSGQGLVNIYHFVRDNKLFNEEENLDLRFLIEGDQEVDIAAIIAKYAIEHKDIMAIRALDIFVKIYGSVVGNLALTMLPYGGLYIVGGIAPKLLAEIKKGKFMEIYFDKGRVSNLLKDVPLYVVLNTDVGLHGAAIYAQRLMTT